jgi:hypothetical protein
MEKLEADRDQSGRYYRIIALWVLIETVLGGILHGLHIPVTGFVVGGLALFCQIALAWHFPQKGSVLKATLLVLIWKAMLSPQSPPTAYLAVAFQGVLAEFFLRPFGKSMFLFRALFFGVVTQLESAFQRLLVLIFITGEEFRKAFDAWLLKTTGLEEAGKTSFILVSVYLALHVLAGLIFSYSAWRLVSGKVELHDQQRINWKFDRFQEISSKTDKKGSQLWLLIGGLLLFWLVLSWVAPKWAPLPGHKTGKLILRFVLVLGSWLLLIQPALRYLIKRFLNRFKGQLAQELSTLEGLLPEIQQGIRQAWKLASGSRFRTWTFLQILLLNLLAFDEKS